MSISCPKTFHGSHGICNKVSIILLSTTRILFSLRVSTISAPSSCSLLPHKRDCTRSQASSVWSPSSLSWCHSLPQECFLLLGAPSLHDYPLTVAFWTTLWQMWFILPLSPPSSVLYLSIVLTSYLMFLLYTPLVQGVYVSHLLVQNKCSKDIWWADLTKKTVSCPENLY